MDGHRISAVPKRRPKVRKQTKRNAKRAMIKVTTLIVSKYPMSRKDGLKG